MLGLLLAGALTADPPQASLITRFASPSVPPGGTAQIQLFLAEPHAFATGSVIVDFDSTVFGDVLAADVFSATGDQFGTANIKGSHVDVEFQSTIGEIGRLPNVPVVTIVVQVLAGAINLSMGTVSVTAGATPWVDAGGYTYSMTAQPGSLSVGGSLSVQEVRQGGGMLPAGTVVLIAGTGFTADTTVQMDGVSFGSVQFAGPQRINLTLTAPADLTGKHVIVRNPDGAQVDYVSALRGFFVENAVTELSTSHPIFPQQTYTAVHP